MTFHEQTVAALNTELRHRTRGHAHLTGIPQRRNAKRMSQILIELLELERAQAAQEEQGDMTPEQTGARLAEIGFVEYYNEAKVAELRAAFDRVASSPNWKTAINAEIEATVDEIGTVKEAVTFYTGSVARVERLETLGIDTETGAYRLRVRVQASGYYAAVGA
jgi:hypothetical protein